MNTLFEGSGEQWDELISRYGHGLQGYAFGELLTNSMGQTIERHALERDGQLMAALSFAHLRHPLFGRHAISMPIADRSGIVAVDQASADQLLAEMVGRCRELGVQSLQLRHAEDDAIQPVGHPYLDHKLSLRLPLPADADELWGKISAKVRNLARKGQKAGLVHRSGGKEFLPQFWAVYTQNLRDLGTPCYPKALFELWLELYPGSAQIHIAENETGECVAVGFCFLDGERQLIPFAASRREYRNISPNMFLYWEMLRCSIEAGATSFDFGRSTRDSGTHRFKKQWGAVELPLHWYSVGGEAQPLPDAEGGLFALASRVWKKLPVPLASSLGPQISRHLP